MTFDTWHVTCDMRHVTRDMWNMTRDRNMWHVVGVNILTNFQLPSSYGFKIFEDLEEKADSLTHSLNQLVTKLFVKPPRLQPGLLKNVY